MPSILLEFCQTNLSACLKKLDDNERIQIIIEIASAMKAIHSSNIIHRDLKPQKVLLGSNHHVKLCDFGLCKLLNSEELNETFTPAAGTIKYMDQELIQERTDYNEKVDVYAFGVVCYKIPMNREFPKITIDDVCLGKVAPISSNK